MADYPENAVKQDPDTGYLAQRSMFEADSWRAWWVFNLDGNLVMGIDPTDWTDLVAIPGPLPDRDFDAFAVKQDPETACLAVRTGQSDNAAWRVMRTDRTHLVAHQDVAHWHDLVKEG